MIFRHSFDRKFGRVHGRQIVKLTPTPHHRPHRPNPAPSCPAASAPAHHHQTHRPTPSTPPAAQPTPCQPSQQTPTPQHPDQKPAPTPTCSREPAPPPTPTAPAATPPHTPQCEEPLIGARQCRRRSHFANTGGTDESERPFVHRRTRAIDRHGSLIEARRVGNVHVVSIDREAPPEVKVARRPIRVG